MSKAEATSSEDDLKDEDQAEEVPKTKGRKSNKKKAKNETTADDEPAETSSKSKSKRGAKSGKSPKSEESSNEEEQDLKVPLLDQPAIVEGSRNRKTVISLEKDKIPVSKQFKIEIPNGKGIPLGRIPVVNTRLKQREGRNILRELHRALFGRIGKAANYLSTFQKFRGFSFEKDSEEYEKKLVVFNKLHMPDLNELLFCFDLDMKTKKKEDAVKRILDFLLSPKASENSHKPPPPGHPKRKATKRNYYEVDVEAEFVRKKKKSKAAAKPKDEKEETEVKENGEVEPKSRGKKSSDKDAADDQSQKNDDSETDNNNELKKPAKKRKRNQVIEETEDTPEEPKSKKKEAAAKTKGKETKKGATKGSAAENEALTDEELKSFLKEVLANANLEETTMKTVYGLISSHYPNYDFSKKKDFIKDVVKSLIRS